MRRAVLLVIVLLLLFAGLYALLQLGQGDDRRAPDGPIATAPADAKPTAPLDERADEARAAPELAQPSAAPEARALVPAQPATIAGPRRTATVRVLPPSGCAADESVEVAAFAKFRFLERALADLYPTPKPHERRNPMGFEDGDDDEDDASQLIARAERGVDGLYRLELPAAAEDWHLLAVGRSWHALSTREVKATDEPVELETICGAWIEGRAVLPAGTDASAVEDALVQLESDEGEDVARAARRGEQRAVRRRAAIRDTRFEFRALPAALALVARATPDRLPETEAKIEPLAAGRGTAVALEFKRGASVRGRVRSADGAPIAGAELEAQRMGSWFGFDDRPVRWGKSGADGSFELPAVPAGKVEVEAFADGWTAEKGVKLDAVEGSVHEGVELVLSRGAAVAGTLAWADGRPAAGVNVRVSFDMSAMAGMGAFNARTGAKGEASTDAAGKFRVDGLGKGPFRVEARGLPADEAALSEAAPSAELDAKQRSRREHRAYAEGVKPGTTDLALVLHAPSGVRGRVVDTQGAPVAKFTLAAKSVGSGMLGMIGQQERTEKVADERGEFLLDGLQAGAWRLAVEAEGFADSAGVELALPQAKDVAPLLVTLQRQAVVRGTVLGSQGEPVANAEVAIDDGQPVWSRVMRATTVPTTRSREDGRFELVGVAPGTAAITAEHEAFARSEPETFEVAEAQVVEGVALRLRTGGKITGEVYHEGAPAKGYLVQATEMKRFAQRMAHTRADGSFELLHLEPGGYQVVAMPSSGAELGQSEEEFDASSMMTKFKMASADVKDGEAVHLVLGAPPEDPVKVHGRVLLAGAGIASASLSFVSERGAGLGALKTTGTKADGTYEITLDGPGAYGVSVQRFSQQMDAQSVYEQRVEVPKGTEYELDITLPQGRISGRVLDADGEPLAGARVSIARDGTPRVGTMWGGQFHELRTGADGTYDALGLEPGAYSVSAGGAELYGLLGDASNAVGGRETRSGLKVAEDEWLRGVDFRLGEPGSVEITVVDAGGQPVAKATVFVRDASGRGLETLSGTITDGSGSARYGGLAPGRYSFRARTGTGASVESPLVTLERGGTAAVRLVLDPATTVVVKVEGAQGQHLPASVEVFDADNREVARALGLGEIMERFSAGAFGGEEQRFGPFPPGKYKVRATLADGRVETKSVSLSGQPERKLTLRLE